MSVQSTCPSRASSWDRIARCIAPRVALPSTASPMATISSPTGSSSMSSRCLRRHPRLPAALRASHHTAERHDRHRHGARRQGETAAIHPRRGERFARKAGQAPPQVRHRLRSDSMRHPGIEGAVTGALADRGVNARSVPGVEPDAALGKGGLDRLAARFMESMATVGIVGVDSGRLESAGFRLKSGIRGVSTPRPAGPVSECTRVSWFFGWPLESGGERGIRPRRCRHAEPSPPAHVPARQERRAST